jgi:hypothetical protein
MRSRLPALLGAAALGLAAMAARANGLVACAEAGAPYATVTAKSARDGVTVQLSDGREVRLAGVVAAKPAALEVVDGEGA